MWNEDAMDRGVSSRGREDERNPGEAPEVVWPGAHTESERASLDRPSWCICVMA